MKLFLLSLSATLLSFTYSHGDNQQVTLSCPSSPDADRGSPGVPGKRGSKGEKGESCDDQSQCVSRAEIEEIQETLLEIQRNITEQQKEITKSCRCTNGTVSTPTSPPGATVASTSSSTSTSVRSCDDVYNNGQRNNGVYSIYTGQQFVEVYCQFQSEGHNWMIIQRRIDGTVDFYLNWDSFENGFGNKMGEYWLGLQAMHEITTSRSYRLRVDLEDWEGNHAHVEYSTFSIGNRSGNYPLNLGQYLGGSAAASDSLSYHNGSPFSTKDRDNDAWATNCAVMSQGAWWYVGCQLSNLNGRYHRSGPDPTRTGIEWHRWKATYSMKRASMKIRPN